MHEDAQEYRQEAVWECREMDSQDCIIISWRHNISRNTHSSTLAKILQSDNLCQRLADETKTFKVLTHRSQPLVGEDQMKRSCHEDMAPPSQTTQIRIVGGRCLTRTQLSRLPHPTR